MKVLCIEASNLTVDQREYPGRTQRELQLAISEFLGENNVTQLTSALWVATPITHSEPTENKFFFRLPFDAWRVPVGAYERAVVFSLNHKGPMDVQLTVEELLGRLLFVKGRRTLRDEQLALLLPSDLTLS